ncbi:hypothetical protein H8A99_08655 [Bradyrhizobium sp. Arg68]|uniref:GDSL-type esterase/lipase family protein n=1 Tax=Bradyrhizobium ivorense TaxID=2511166 RepID=UPI001E3A4E50|nr:GDSL-type esterase/lipase family protein [Bradyrhizobium ivorense]MCC8936565.1 hypothetical protein [Bradyrhizobium ivorense]
MRKGVLVAFVVLAAATLAYQLLETPVEKLRQDATVRRVQDFMARHGTDKAIAFVGDSLVESASLSPKLCGRPVFNAGYAGAVASGVLQLLKEFDRVGFSPAIVVVSVGVNDSLVVDRRPFAESYQEIVRRAGAHGGKVFVVSLAPIADTGVLANAIDRARFADVDRTIRQTARDRSLALIDVGTLNTPAKAQVEDGIHLSADGYAAWTGTIESAINGQCP